MFSVYLAAFAILWWVGLETAAFRKGASTGILFVKNRKHNDLNHKMEHALWKLIGYGSSTIIGLAMLAAEPWFSNPTKYNIFSGDGSIRVSSLVIGYSHLMFGWYTYDLIKLLLSCVAKKNPDSDFIEILVHHTVSLASLVSAMINNYICFAVIVLWIHDVADPFLYLAKIFVYKSHLQLEINDTRAQSFHLIADVMLILYQSIFFAALNGFYPYLIYVAFMSNIYTCNHGG
ncbi:hypothetical protein HK100_006443, partial [Physocladia obscura]